MTIEMRVHALTWQAEGVIGVALQPCAPGVALPAAEPGAHIDLTLPDGSRRSYSLIEPDPAPHSYQIAVGLDRASRGGSRWIHENLRPGACLPVAEPTNQFPLDESAATSVLIAGGIGITPILSMVRRLSAIGRKWELHYACRTRRQAAFVDTLRELAEHTGATLALHWDQEAGGTPIAVADVVAVAPADAHLYCCGPTGMLEAFRTACSTRPARNVHFEYFATDVEAATQGGFSVVLARRGVALTVAAGQSILDTLEAAGIELPYSCREGICGTCEVRVLAGEPDHRDMVLDETRRAANDRMMICCSGARSASLTLDI
ncbi:MAG: PDR/VanB family oxidoreductase [Burkholderiaceae bacterium]